MPDITSPIAAANKMVQMDPISAFFVEYCNYILFGVGLFLLLYFGRRAVLEFLEKRNGGDSDAR
jgi:hypothetical protein